MVAVGSSGDPALGQHGSDAAEVHELQARIRELEALRKTRGEEAARIVASQRSTIDRLKTDNQRLAADLAVGGGMEGAAVAAIIAGGSAGHLSKPTSLTPAQSQRVDKLTELVDTYSRKIEVEKRQLESLEREVELAQAQLLAARRDVGGHSGALHMAVAPAKAIKALEHRLEVARRRFNEHIAANRDLKAQIDAATRRQAGMEQVRAHLEREVAGVAAELAGVQEAGRVAGEARTEALAQAAAMRVAEDAEEAAFEVEVRELAGAVAADEKLLMAQADRLTKVVEAAEAAEGAGPGAGGQLSGGAEPLDLDALEQGPGVEAAAAQLMRAAGLSSLHEALSHYSGLEAASFEAFTACNAASEQLAELGRQARELEAEVRALEAEGVAGRQHDAIRGVLAKRDAAARRAEALHERRAELERRAAMLRAGISSCLHKLGATAAAERWEAAAPRPPSAAQGWGSSGAAADSGAYGMSASAAHPTAAACAHVVAGLAVLEQRAAAIIAVQGTMVGRVTPGGSRPASAALVPPRPPSGLAPAAPSSLPATAATTAATSRPTSGASAAGRGESGTTVASGGGGGGRVEMIVEEDGPEGREAEEGEGEEEEEEESGSEEDEVPLTREQIQARAAASMGLADSRGGSGAGSRSGSASGRGRPPFVP